MNTLVYAHLEKFRVWVLLVNFQFGILLLATSHLKNHINTSINFNYLTGKKRYKNYLGNTAPKKIPPFGFPALRTFPVRVTALISLINDVLEAFVCTTIIRIFGVIISSLDLTARVLEIVRRLPIPIYLVELDLNTHANDRNSLHRFFCSVQSRMVAVELAIDDFYCPEVVFYYLSFSSREHVTLTCICVRTFEITVIYHFHVVT